MKNLIDFEIILASSSPRRIEFLKNLNIKFKVVSSNINEDKYIKKPPEDISIQNAFKKALSVANKFKDRYVAGFDTIVVINDKILGKPKDKDDAFNMLQLLSGKKHFVITGFSIINLKKNIEIKKAVITEVWFKKLDKKEIEWYLDTGEPYDKAGAYAIQGKGAFMVKKINGSYTNVVGLPLAEFLEVLKRLK